MWEHVTGGVGPAREDASRSVRPEPRSARHSQVAAVGATSQPTPSSRSLALAARVRAQARGPPAEGRRAEGEGALAGRTDWTPPPFPLGAARHGTAPPGCPPHRASPWRRRHPDPYLQPHRRCGAGGAGARDVRWLGLGTAAQADKAARRLARTLFVPKYFFYS